MKPRLQRSLKIAEQIERKLQITRQILFGKRTGNLCEPLALLRRSGDQLHVPHLGHQQVAKVTRHLAAEVLQVAAVALQILHDRQHPSRT